MHPVIAVAESPGTPAGPVHRDPGSAPARPGRCGRALLLPVSGQSSSALTTAAVPAAPNTCPGPGPPGCGLRPPARWLASCSGGSGRAAGRTGRTFGSHHRSPDRSSGPFPGRENTDKCHDLRRFSLNSAGLTALCSAPPRPGRPAGGQKSLLPGGRTRRGRLCPGVHRRRLWKPVPGYAGARAAAHSGPGVTYPQHPAPAVGRCYGR